MSSIANSSHIMHHELVCVLKDRENRNINRRICYLLEISKMIVVVMMYTMTYNYGCTLLHMTDLFCIFVKYLSVESMIAILCH